MQAPIIASSTDPVKEVIEDGVNGHLVDFFDKDALAAKVIEVLKNPEDQVELRRNARDTIVQNYDLRSKCLPAHVRLVESLFG